MTVNEYIDANYQDSIPAANLKEIKNYYRFVYFWQERLGIVNDSLSYLPYTWAAIDNITNPICSGPDSADWQLLGPAQLDGDKQWLGLVQELLYDPANPENYLVSTDRGGIWKKEGNTWKNKTDNLRFPGLAATEIIRDPDSSAHLFASTAWGILNSGNYGVGLIESWNNGESWSVVDSFPYQTMPFINRVIYDPTDNEHLMAIGINLKNIPLIYQSLDGGLSWDSFLPELPDSIGQGYYPTDIEVDNYGHIYLSLNYIWNAGSLLLKYDNSQWIDLNKSNNYVFGDSLLSFRITKPSGGLIFALCDSNNRNATGQYYRRVYKTEDYGSSWNLVKTFDPLINRGSPQNEIEYSPNSQNVYVGGIRLFVLKPPTSGNEYTSFLIDSDASGKKYHIDIRDFDFMGVDSLNYEHVLVANDGGVSYFKFRTWNPNDYDHMNLNGASLPIGDFVGFAASNKNQENVIGGTVHCANFYYNDQSWEHINGFDGGDCAISWTDPETYYFMSNNLVYKSDSLPVKTLFYSEANWFIGMSYEINPFDPNMIYFGRKKMDFGGTEKATLVIYDGVNTYEKGVSGNMGAVGAIEVSADNKLYVADFGSADTELSGRLAVSSDNGDNWLDLSMGLVSPSSNTLSGIIKYKTISSIVCHPFDTNKIWLGISGIFTDQNGMPVEEQYRVLYSTNAGSSWVDYSEGLSPFPVKDIIYQDASPDRLFLGTDVGVFYRDSTMNQWECFSNNLPVSIITKLDYDVCSRQLYASTYGRAIYKTDVPFEDETLTLAPGQISWDNGRKLTTNLFIPDGTTLSISGDLYIASGVKIMVDRGAKLIIEDCKLTNLCDDLWDGIEVWGYSDTSQVYTGVQGTVEFYDATIENAYKGVVTGQWNDLGLYSRGYEGGIIKARNTTFQNIIEPVIIKPYENIFPPTQNETNNLCRFDNCTFRRTDTAIYTHQHVKLEDVYGVRFRGCTFVDETEFDPTLIYKSRGTGIAGEASTFYVEQYCLNPQVTPCNDLKPCTFKHLKVGIRGDGVFPNNTCVVEYALLDSNKTGIYLSNMDQVTVIRNDFKIPYFPDSTEMLYFSGLYLDYCTGYTIEENTFRSDYYPNLFVDQASIGLVVNNSGELPNEIYNNYCDSVFVGILAQNNNRNEAGNSGLQIKCNDFSTCEYDIAVTADSACFFPGIKDEQGNSGDNPTDPANNLFSYTWNNGESDFYNGCRNLDYWYLNSTSGDSTEPENYSQAVSPQPGLAGSFNKPTNCPSNIDSGVSEGLEDQRSLLDASTTSIDSTQNLLETLVDGGSTETLTLDVQTSTPDEALEIHNELMAHSPYLSDSVMVSATEKENVLTPAMITDILISNPQAAKSDTVQNALDKRLNLLSEEQRSDIDQGWFTIGAKESLESSLSKFMAQRQQALNNMIRLTRNDTLHFARQDSVIAFLTDETDLSSKYKLAFEYLSKGNTTQAESIIDDIPNQFALTSSQQNNHLQYDAFAGILASYKNQNKSIFTADQGTINTLYGLYSGSTGKLKSSIRNILTSIDTLIYEEPYILPDDMLKQYEIRRIPVRKVYNENLFRMYPNPANTYVVFEYEMNNKSSNVWIELVNSNGVSHKKIMLKNQRGYLIIPLSNLKTGVYFIRLASNNNVIDVQKLLIYH